MPFVFYNVINKTWKYKEKLIFDIFSYSQLDF